MLALFLLVWEGTARLGWIDSFIFSQPSRILRTYWDMAQNGLLYHMAVTIGETLAGFLLGAAAGVLLAIVLWWSPTVSRISEPYLVVLNSLPKIALGPVIIILAGAGTRAIVFMALAISLVVTGCWKCSAASGIPMAGRCVWRPPSAPPSGRSFARQCSPTISQRCSTRSG